MKKLFLLVSLLSPLGAYAQPTTPSTPVAPAVAPVEVKPGVALPIRYKLLKAGKVSINIYNEKGAVVRELLHIASRPSGDSLDVWDGLDNDGKALPAGQYSWKVLSTPGLKAEYLMTVGSNYPVMTDTVASADTHDASPGTHVGPAAVFADESGIIVAAGDENNEPSTVKISLDGKKKLWNIAWPGVYQRRTAFCRVGPYIWALISDGSIVSYEPGTGDRAHTGHAIWQGDPSIGAVFTKDNEKQNPTDLTSDGDYVVTSYGAGKATTGALRWFDTKTTKLETEVPLANAIALANDGKGNVYASNGTEIYRVSRAAPTPVKIIDGLKEARTLCVDASGDLLVFDGGQYGEGDSQVKRFSADGKFLKAYGRKGGREYGLYTTEAQQSFNGVSDIEAMPGGGFVVCEPNSPPRRTAVFDKDGKIVREWYGGQTWAPWITPEPDNPNAVWMGSSWSGFMRCIVDLKTKTWKVHSTYGYGVNALFPSVPSSIGWTIEARMHGGELYLVLNAAGLPRIYRVDRKNWKLMPVVAIWPHLPFTVQQGKAGELPPMMVEAVNNKTAKDTALWTDADGDGQVQPSEIQWTNKSVWAGGGTMDKDFNLFTVSSKYLATIPNTGWNKVGAPIYDPETFDFVRVGPNLPAREAGGNSALARDPQTGDFYSAKNYQTGWAASKDSFMSKLKPDGTLVWTVGREGSQQGQIGYFRRIFGFAHGCITAVNTSEGHPRSYVWDKDGLFVGGLFDTVKTDGINWSRYDLAAESINGNIYEDPKTGEVLLFAHWSNEGRIYRITGWDNWERASGTLDLKAPAEVGGNGLVAAFYKSDASTRVGQWTASTPAFEPNQLKSATAKSVAQSGKYLVRFSGQIAAPADGEYSFSVKGEGSVHLVVGPYVAIDRWDGHNTSTPVVMKANQRVAFQLEYSPSGKDKGVELLWNLKGQESTPVPQSALFIVNDEHELPLAHGTGLTGKYYVAWLPGGGLGPNEGLPAPSITRVDPVIDFTWNKADTPENAPLLDANGRPAYVVVWKGFFVPRDSGNYSLRAFPVSIGSVRFNNAAQASPWGGGGYLKAGQKYPIEIYYNSFHHGHIKPRPQHQIQLQMAGPHEDYTIVPQSQLFPAE